MSIDSPTQAIKLAELKSLIEAHDKTIRIGKPGVDSSGQEITDQTKSIYFTLEEIEKLTDFLNQDPLYKDIPKTEKGVKIYLGCYTEEIAKRYYPDHEKYVGKTTVALITALGKKGGQVKDILPQELEGEDEDKQRKPPVENVGTLCPPNC